MEIPNSKFDNVSVVSIYGNNGTTVEHSTITGPGIEIKVDHTPFTIEQSMRFTTLLIEACQKFWQEVFDDAQEKLTERQ